MGISLTSPARRSYRIVRVTDKILIFDSPLANCQLFAVPRFFFVAIQLSTLVKLFQGLGHDVRLRII